MKELRHEGTIASLMRDGVTAAERLQRLQPRPRAALVNRWLVVSLVFFMIGLALKLWLT